MNYPNGMTKSDLEHVGEIPDRNWERMQPRIAYLEAERAKALDEIEQAKDYIDELNDELGKLRFGDE